MRSTFLILDEDTIERIKCHDANLVGGLTAKGFDRANSGDEEDSGSEQTFGISATGAFGGKLFPVPSPAFYLSM